MKILEALNIEKSFGSLKVLDSISFSIERGEIVSIVGESGCGKTTFIKILSELISPSNGSIKKSYDRIGYIPQNLGLLPWRNVEENIRFPLELLGEKNIDVSPIINMLSLEQFSKYKIHQLSGGMQQRVAIGRAIVTKPDILFLDEPFRSLDEITRYKLNNELKTLWWELKSTVVFVTHSIREAVCLSDRIIILSDRPAEIKGEVIKQTRYSHGDILTDLETKVRNILFN